MTKPLWHACASFGAFLLSTYVKCEVVVRVPTKNGFAWWQREQKIGCTACTADVRPRPSYASCCSWVHCSSWASKARISVKREMSGYVSSVIATKLCSNV